MDAVHLMVEMIRSSILSATPVLLAGLGGGAYTYYADVFNIAMEGMMLIGGPLRPSPAAIPLDHGPWEFFLG